MRYSTLIFGAGPKQVVLYEGSSLKLNQIAELKARDIMKLTSATGTVSVFMAGSATSYFYENGQERLR